MPTGRDDVRFQVRTGSHGQTVKMTRMTQAVWKRFSSPKNCKQPGAMDLDATV
jgi:hypothetical protein